jgi:hypothetical protein
MSVGLVLIIAVPLCLLAGALPGALISRQQRMRAPGAFRCRVRAQSGLVAGLRYDFRRRQCHWIHDVLVVSRAGLLPRSQPLGVRSVGGIEYPDGEHVALRVNLDNGAVLRLVAERPVSALVVGPFLAAALQPASRADS